MARIVRSLFLLLKNCWRCLHFVLTEILLNFSWVILNSLKLKLLYTGTEFSRGLYITVFLNPWILFNSWFWFFAISVCFFNALINGEYSNFFIVFFLVKYLRLLKIYVCQHFQMIKLLVYLNYILLCFVQFCY